MIDIVVKSMLTGFGISFAVGLVYILIWAGIVKVKKLIERSNPWYIVREYLEE